MGSACDLDLIQEDHLGKNHFIVTDHSDNDLDQDYVRSLIKVLRFFCEPAC